MPRAESSECGRSSCNERSVSASCQYSKVKAVYGKACSIKTKHRTIWVYSGVGYLWLSGFGTGVPESAAYSSGLCRVLRCACCQHICGCGCFGAAVAGALLILVGLDQDDRARRSRPPTLPCRQRPWRRRRSRRRPLGLLGNRGALGAGRAAAAGPLPAAAATAATALRGAATAATTTADAAAATAVAAAAAAAAAAVCA
jgi:hypothetical protein